ncbi:MAG: hypothetical protein JWQ40_4705 [Segetibacter sp.]|jgi:hypothetical protein|nr:hypothetical protein [Segetibacter sp.]
MLYLSLWGTQRNLYRQCFITSVTKRGAEAVGEEHTGANVAAERAPTKA